MKIANFLGIAALISLGGCCTTTYDAEISSDKEGNYVFARPDDYFAKSAREWLEIVNESQTRLANGNLRVALSLRNRGNQRWYNWFFASNDMTVYAAVDFLDAENRTTQHVPKQAIALPLGETVHVEWLATSPAAASARVTFSE